MRFEHYDIINALHDHLEEFRARHAMDPKVLVLSPASYHWLRSIHNDELSQQPVDDTPDIGDWSFAIDDLSLRIEIDEMADDFTIRLR